MLFVLDLVIVWLQKSVWQTDPGENEPHPNNQQLYSVSAPWSNSPTCYTADGADANKEKGIRRQLGATDVILTVA